MVNGIRKLAEMSAAYPYLRTLQTAQCILLMMYC